MMDTEYKDVAIAPFQERCNTDLFFTGGGRGAILDDIKAALASKAHIVTLIGDEGSGKTMICHMLQEQLSKSCKIIFLPQILGSFEAVVRVVAQECAVAYPAKTSRADARKIFLDLVAIFRSKGKSLILINDEAENIYLATLERLRKILDDVNEDGGGLQLIFSGRKGLRGNLDQLAICDFAEVCEKQFFLSALDDNETWLYLNFCVQDPQDAEPREVFTMEAASKIASMGGGDLHMINAFAEESLKSSSAETSFLVLLDHVSDDGSKESLLSPSNRRIRFPFPRKYLFAGIVVCFLFLLLLLFRGGEDDATPLGDVAVIDVPSTVADEKVAIVEEEVVKKSEPLVKSVVPVLEAKPVAIVQQPIAVVQQPVSISPVKIVEKKENFEPQVQVLETQSKFPLSNTKHIVAQSEEPASEPVAVSSQTATVTDPSLASLAVAGDRWLLGEEDTHFSIQLMALQSEHAEENLKRIIAQADYQKVLDKLVLLKRPSSPPILLVFYGLYPDMAAARNARNNMPIFLRDRHPYPVSVRGAVEKARAW